MATSLLLLAGSEVPSAAADAESLGLGEAMSRARERGRHVSAASSRHQAALSRLDQARGYRLPTVRLSESWIRTDSPAEVFALQLNQERFRFSDFVAADPNRPAALETAISRIEVEVPIWTGGEISTRVEQARLSAEAARDAGERAGDLAALGAADAWLDLVRAGEAVALLERSRQTVAAHVELARAFSAQGMIVHSDLLRAEVELARIDDLLAAARRGATVAQSALALQLAEPLDRTFTPGQLPPVAAGPGEIEHWLSAADRRVDLESARKRLAAGELEERALRAARRPRIGLVARHDWTDDRLLGGHGSASTVMAAATFDLFDGGRRRNQAAAAAAEADAGRSELELFAESIELEVRGAHAAFAAALERQATAGAALDAAAEGLRIVEERFAAGVIRSLDVLDAANARREAEMRELVARTDAHAAVLHLAVAAGRAPESVLSSLLSSIPAGSSNHPGGPS